MNLPKYKGAYVGESLENLITEGIQWVGEKILGSEVSKETSESIQLATAIATAIVPKGKNTKANAELGEQVIKSELKVVDKIAIPKKFKETKEFGYQHG